MVGDNQSCDITVTVGMITKVREGFFTSWFEDAGTEKVLNVPSVWVK
jgi:hypothetical protein